MAPASASGDSVYSTWAWGWPVVSARPGPIRAMNPDVEIEPLP